MHAVLVMTTPSVHTDERIWLTSCMGDPQPLQECQALLFLSLELSVGQMLTKVLVSSSNKGAEPGHTACAGRCSDTEH